ncbi:MAG: NERD domain-containing protein [Betaproteobacteria bacterium]|nr:NERD domain-containing protein [Betaproteobacteria bacterium]
MKQDKRSPITDKPLRNPGQSLEKRRDDLLYDKVLAPMLLAFMMILLAGMEWWYYFNPKARNPVVATIFAIAILVYAIFRIWRTWPELQQLRQGIEGEKAVGQFLERLRESGYQVFHDLMGDDFNVDHAIIGPAGVFTIETKTISKPMRGEVKIQFDGEHIQINGQTMERNPVRQAQAQAGWLKKILQESTGREYKVHPVVVFPGWFIERKDGSSRELWVLEPKALPKFLENAPEVLSTEEIKMASVHLSRFIRSQEKLDS